MPLLTSLSQNLHSIYLPVYKNVSFHALTIKNDFGDRSQCESELENMNKEY